MKTFEGLENYRFILPKLWNKQNDRHVEFNIFDTILIERQSITTWLFTSKEGLVKSKSNRRKETLAEIAAHFDRLCSFSELQIPSVVFLTKSSEYLTIKSKSQLLEILEDKSNESIVVIIPNAAMKSKSIVKVTYERPIGSVSTSSGFLDTSKLKIKLYLPSKPVLGDIACFELNDFVESKNTIYNCAGKESMMRLIHEIESKSAYRVDRVTAYFSIGLEDTTNSTISQNSYKLWLHHVETTSVSQKQPSKLQDHDSISCASSRLSALDALTKSRVSYLKPWNLCMGDFCPLSCNKTDVIDWDSDGFDGLAVEGNNDLSIESKKAINRHRKVEGQLSISDDSTSVNVSNGETQYIPIKERTVMIKSILLAREEMQLLDDIDKRYVQLIINTSHGKGCGEDSKLQMKADIEFVWPIRIARWWLAEGRQFQPVIPKVGKPPVHNFHLNSNHQRNPTGSSNNIDYLDGNRWFSWYYSQAQVCENCYFNYQQLEIYRKSTHKKLQHQARLESVEAKLTPEERKLRDRRIEQQIFSQRQLATRLSKSKSLVQSNDDLILPQHRLQSGNIEELLPAVPWRHTTYNNFERKASIASHILNKSSNTIFQGSDSYLTESVANEWENMRQRSFLEPLGLKILNKPTRKKKTLKTVDVNNYNAHRLLHPWQRDLDKLKNSKNTPNIGQREISPLNNQQGVSSVTNAPLPPLSSTKFQPSRTSSWHEAILEEDDERDEDSDGEFYEDNGLGWNPFVLNGADS